jgi:quinol monooxygenase YgiN
MYGFIARLRTLPGSRDEMIEILQLGVAGMPGCISYVVARDTADDNTLWVTEVWDSIESHDASLSLPAVKTAANRARAIVSGFEKVAVTEPVWGSNLT